MVGTQTLVDLPANRHLAWDIKLLSQMPGLGGPEAIDWDEHGRWIRLRHFPLPKGKFGFSASETYLDIMVPADYGERAGFGAGLEEFYVDRNLKVRVGGNWVEIPHTYTQLDRRGGRASGLLHRYVCLHIDWCPRPRGRNPNAVGDTVLTSLNLLKLMLRDPWTFAKQHGG